MSNNNEIHAIFQVIRHRLLTTEAWVHYQNEPCRIYGGQRGRSPSTPVSLQIIILYVRTLIYHYGYVK
jgi:hypothetical protein